MTTASDVITRGLRLINVPGRGAVLSGDDTDNALETLKDIVNTESVSRCFVPGIRRHFFDLTTNKSVYSYGPGGDFDTDLFDDMIPVRIEDAYIRSGSSIIDNEQVTNGDFDTTGDWTLGTGWSIGSGVLTIAAGNDTETASQALSLDAGDYTLKITPTHRDGSVTLQVADGVSNPVNVTLSGSGEQLYSFTHSGGASSITLTADADADMDFDDISILEDGLDKRSLPDPNTGASDYPVDIIDQKTYNRRFSKGNGGRAYQLLYSRAYPLAEVRFDNASSSGDILVMDVLASQALSSLSSDVRLHPEGITWLKYRLAYEEAGAYGKSLNTDQKKIMRDAWYLMAAGNKRVNNLRMDRGLRRRRGSFNINRGDP